MLWAIPYPQVQSGGIRAVAIATPGITFDFSFLVIPIIPANPPQEAIITSQTLGCVLANSSDVSVEIGESLK